MIDLKTVKEIRISEGSVTKITDSSGVVLWQKETGTTAQTPCYYVADNVSDLPQSLYQAEYAQIGIQKFLITDYHWNVNSKAVVEFEINSDTNEFGRYGRILAIEGEQWYSSQSSIWNVENTFWQTKPFGSTSWNRSTVVPNLHQKYVGEYAETGLTIDGTVITATTPSTSITANTSHYVCIGGYNTTDQTEYLDGKIYSVKIYESGTLVRDIVPLTNGLFYDKLSKKVYAAGAGGACDTGGTSTLLVKNESKYDMAYITSEKSWYVLNNQSQWEKYGVIEDEYDAPNLDYTECANEAAMKALSCPYEGMKVKLTDTGKKYKFTYNSTTSQYEWDEITSSLDIDLNNQWIESTKTLDGYRVYMSNSNHNVDNGYASMKFKFKGMPDFKLWINSYAESSYDYTVAWNLDVDYPTSNPSNGSTGVKANTSGKQYNPTNITAFTEVDYSNDGGEHFVVVTYRKDGSASRNDDRGYVAVKLTLLSTTWVVSATEFIKKDDKYYQRINEVGTYEGGVTALTGNYKEGNELTVTYKQGPADDFMVTDGKMYYKNYIYVTPKDQEINTGDYVQGDYIGEATPSMTVTYTDNSEKTFYNLTSIEKDTDPNKRNVKNVVIYDSVTSIGNEAFRSCSSLTGITIGNGVTSIGTDAFSHCSSLTSITIPDSVTNLGWSVFEGCSNLESVTIQNSNNKLAYNVFAFSDIDSSAKLFVPSNLLADYQSDSKWTDAFKGGIYAIGT